jgi:hypothetical protein
MEGPKPTGKFAAVDLVGMLLPFHNGQPVLVQVPGSNDRFIPVFDEHQDLVATMIAAQAIYDKIKQIEPNVHEFLQSLVEAPIPIKLMVNPYFMVEGKIRYLEMDPRHMLEARSLN